jgi:hypothetical protein
VGDLEDKKALKYAPVKISKRYQEEFLEFATHVSRVTLPTLFLKENSGERK